MAEKDGHKPSATPTSTEPKDVDDSKPAMVSDEDLIGRSIVPGGSTSR